jgi:excisionase family DNA binding protein
MLEVSVNESTQLLTVPEFAKVTRTSISWVYAKIKSRDLVGIRLPGNRLLRIPASELAKVLLIPRDVGAATEAEVE